MAKQNENETSNTPAAREPSIDTSKESPAGGVDMSKIKVLKNVTLPILKQVDNVPMWVKITGAIFTGKEVKGTGDKQKMEPARLADVIDLTTGEVAQIIANKVLESSLVESYPDNGYVGRCFLIERASPEGKRYKTYKILETEDPTA